MKEIVESCEDERPKRLAIRGVTHIPFGIEYYDPSSDNSTVMDYIA